MCETTAEQSKNLPECVIQTGLSREMTIIVQSAVLRKWAWFIFSSGLLGQSFFFFSFLKDVINIKKISWGKNLKQKKKRLKTLCLQHFPIVHAEQGQRLTVCWGSLIVWRSPAVNPWFCWTSDLCRAKGNSFFLLRTVYHWVYCREKIHKNSRGKLGRFLIM